MRYFFASQNETMIRPGTTGVLITKVQPFTPASKSGLVEGDIIYKIGFFLFTQGTKKFIAHKNCSLNWV
jgi:C-terminal processing protease CtpA/Prc